MSRSDVQCEEGRLSEVHFISEPKHKHQIRLNGKLTPAICVNLKISYSLDLPALGTFMKVDSRVWGAEQWGKNGLDAPQKLSKNNFFPNT